MTRAFPLSEFEIESKADHQLLNESLLKIIQARIEKNAPEQLHFTLAKLAEENKS